MASQVYYRKWRPGSFAELVGQEHVAITLRQSIKQSRVSHSYLFCGPRGSGKTTTARIIAKAVNCLDLQDGDPCNACTICQAINDGRFMDIIELDAASNRGIDEIRDIREKVNFSPAQGNRKVYIIDEAHMLTDAAANAFLKTLEEPPGHVIFVLCTTESHKILPTIISRCQRFDFRRIPSELIYQRLAEMVEAEGAVVDPEALRLVSRYAAGSLRDAQNLLEQLVVSSGDEVGLHQVEDLLGLGHGERWLDLVKYLLMGNASASLGVINQAAWDGTDLRQFHRQTLELLRAVLHLQWSSGESLDLADHVVDQLRELVGQLPPWRIVKALRTWGEVNMRYDAPSTLPLELAAVEICEAQAVPSNGPAEQPAPAPVTTRPPPAPQATESPRPSPPIRTEAKESKPKTPVATVAQQTPSQPATADPSDALSSESATADPSDALSSESATAQPSDALSSESTTAQPSDALSSESTTAQPSDALSNESATAQPSNAPPSDSATAQLSDALSNESATAQPSNAPPSESATAQLSDAPPSESATAQRSDAPPSESATAQPSDALPSESATAQPSDALPSESATAQASDALPSESTTAQPSDAQPSEPAPTTAPAAADGDLAGAWTATVKALARHKGKKYILGALLKDCRPDAIYLEGGDTLCLAFAHWTHMERMQEEMEDPRGRRLVSEVIGQCFGKTYEFKLTLIESNGEGGASSRSAQNSPLVRAAMGMGARIIEEVVE